MEINAIVTDVDGTITDAYSRLELDAVREIRCLEAMKYPVIISSGRTFCQISALSIYIGTFGGVICENGGVVGHKNGEMFILGRKENAEIGFEILKEHLGALVQKPKAGSICRIIDIPLERKFPVDAGNKILIEENAPAHIIDSGVAYHLIDISVNKGNGMKKAGEIFNLKTKNMVAIGDNLNDIDMFKIAGYSIALGNAPEDAKKSANYTCTATYGKGFKEAIDHLFQQSILKKTG
jgi:phosphoglycolate phosphatase